MFIIGNFIEAIATVLNISLTTYIWLFILRSIISWITLDFYNPLVIFLYSVTEPFLNLIRRFIPFKNLGIDISPMIAITIIIFIQTAFIQSLFQFALKLKY